MKLSEIVSISGKPGLFLFINSSRVPYTVEELETGRRMPVFGREKMSLLSNISMYTTEGEKPLAEVMQGMYETFGEEIPDAKSVSESAETLKDFMDKALPNWDQERIHQSDIKKLAKWYQILRQKGMDSFQLAEKEEKED
ncbi:MAG: DUF5606 domain-containing protein [Porphyromonas sp.]|uniref:DUF5606 family protein n=1 Tax=Porphyromonas sp. TaxID=1924944 RepID=UPI002A919D70|nr:DUF5606 domain-containing protein [Porphyromonas sp.]MDD7468246.1 DUF5606 domain-containing protein [Bacteroidales bacterium]MDY6102798.1 DUF5606 domain-containing protein [Porphyromonas sp.]